MDGNGEGRNGCSDPATELGEEEVNSNSISIQRAIDETKFAQAGFLIPRQNTILDSYRFWELTEEGWRFVVAEDGSIVAYLPPPLSARLAAWTRNKKILSMQRQLKRMRTEK
jgi:hypothetical protein